jgi:hypothetical protein
MNPFYPLIAKLKIAQKVTTAGFFTVALLLQGSFSFSNESARTDTQINLTSQVNDPFHFELVSFQAKLKSNEKVALNWVTAAEVNTSHFVMQRSVDGNDFDDAALLFTDECDRNTKMEYNYTDPISHIKTGLVYYRLKMVDMNGAYTYSKAVKVRIEKTKDLLATRQ